MVNAKNNLMAATLSYLSGYFYEKPKNNTAKNKTKKQQPTKQATVQSLAVWVMMIALKRQATHIHYECC